jgi:signal transduction histidine kinase
MILPDSYHNKRTDKAIQLYILLISLFILCLFIRPAFSDQHASVRVLIIHSFHKGDRWNDDLGEGISQNLEASSLHPEIIYEYMDSQRYPGRDNHRLLHRLYATKYHLHPPDLVVTTDENALKFILQHHDSLFPDIPVVFCGIKYFNKDMLFGEKDITGIVEKVDIGKNIELAKQINPNISELLIVVDNSDTSIAMILTILSWMKNHPSDLKIEFTPLMTMQKLRSKLSALSKESAVILVNFTSDKDGQLFSSEQSAKIISQSSPVPVYVLWDNYLSNGVLGGYLISAREQGKQVAQIAERILLSGKVNTPPILKYFASQYIFDFQQLKKFKVDFSRLPKQSAIINEPYSFFKQYKHIIYSAILGIVFLITVIVYLSLNILKRQRMEKELTKYSRRLNFLYKADEMILDSHGIASMGEKTLDLVLSTFYYLFYGIIIKDFHKGSHVFVSQDNQRGALSDLLQSNKKIFSPNFEWPDNGEPYGFEKDVFVKVTPIKFKKEVFGVLIYTRGHDKINPKLVQVNEDLARSMATAYSNLRLRMRSEQYEKELKQISMHTITAQENERKHLSHELHDELGQGLTAVGLNLRLVKKKLAQASAGETLNYLNESEDYIRKISQQVHDLSIDLRPPMLDDLGLMATMRWYLHQCEQRSNLSTELTTQGNMSIVLPDAISVTFYRVLQETLNNVMKHSKATNVDVFFRIHQKGVRLYIRDNGKGFSMDDIRRGAIGILGMRERLEALGGHLKVRTALNEGTIVVAKIEFEGKHAQN